MKLFSSSFKFLGIQDELKARPPYRVDDDNYPGDHGNENVSSMIFKAPIVHDLFDTFLVRNDVNSTPSEDDETEKSKPVMDYIARPNLEIFRVKYLLPMLELSAVHRETTEEVRITAIPFYMFRRNPESYFVSSKFPV